MWNRQALKPLEIASTKVDCVVTKPLNAIRTRKHHNGRMQAVRNKTELTGYILHRLSILATIF